MTELNTLRKNPKRFVKQTKNALASSGLLLYVLPFLLIPATIKAFATGNLLGIVMNAGGYAAFLLAAQLLRRGLHAEAIYKEKRIARAPKWPLKTMAAGIIAVTTFTLAWLGAHNSFFVSIAFGGGALLGMFLSYGFDPRALKMVADSHGYTVEEISTTIEAAENTILSIENANDKITNREFNSRIERICETARNILDEMEKNPGTIRRARKFLLVYLDGTNKVTNGYANTHMQADTLALEQNFRTVLDSIESVFKEQKHKLLQEDLYDLDIQIEVLAKQLKHEGIV
ncbi:5-bromo-4-chloroindolyl phosphate hydrolysis family protein [Crenothrix polyspora]|uniref:5-bromo-4-chloroindolyl phosphate hydrolysis protein n=1 Tax=Crenothrix polyspora TaxID=360316 RepID=A0A1R4H8W5_9GAMM|nr:5-bromo-4-chloroindolyl phosphate hydrolysis family protein [Crenothrix polyspora]SJM92663.1 5-bromo-4-chloroindolyl phosphate hydrolysis protein [Crenothrix polyspora]